MVIDGLIEGKYINMRSVQEDDAGFIVGLRMTKGDGKFFHNISPDVNEQKKWISKQQSALGDYYFLMLDKDSNTLGVASIYDVSDSNDAEFGRWVSNGNMIQNIESIILSFDFAFNVLRLNAVYTRTMPSNTEVVKLWRNFGGNYIGEVIEDGILVDKNIVTREMYLNVLRKRHTRLLRY